MNIRKKLMSLSIFVSLFLMLGNTAFAASSPLAIELRQMDIEYSEFSVGQMNINVLIDLQPAELTDIALNSGGRTFLPLRALGDLIGAETEWDSENSLASIKYKGKQVETFNGSNFLVVNGEDVAAIDDSNSEIRAFIYPGNGRLYLPLRAICDNLGLVVNWDSTTNTIAIDTQGVAATAQTVPEEIVTGEIPVQQKIISRPTFAEYSNTANWPVAEERYSVSNKAEMQSKVKTILSGKNFGSKIDKMLIKVFDKAYDNYDIFIENTYHKVDKKVYISRLLETLDKNVTNMRIVGENDEKANMFDSESVAFTQFYTSGEKNILISKAFVDGTGDYPLYDPLPTLLHELTHTNDFQGEFCTAVLPIDILNMYLEGQASVYEALIQDEYIGEYAFYPLVLKETMPGRSSGTSEILVINRISSSTGINSYEAYASLFMLVDFLVSEYEIEAMLKDDWAIEDLRFIIDEKYGEGVYDAVFPHIYAIAIANNFDTPTLNYNDRSAHLEALDELKSYLNSEQDPQIIALLEFEISALELNMAFNEKMYALARKYTDLSTDFTVLYTKVIEEIIIPQINSISSWEDYKRVHNFVEYFSNVMPHFVTATYVGDGAYEWISDNTYEYLPAWEKAESLLNDKSQQYN